MSTHYSTPTPLAPFIIMTSSAQVKGRAKLGRYINVAVVQTDGVAVPSMISDRARHCVAIVRHYGTCSEGTTIRSQSGWAMDDARKMVDRLNAEWAAAATQAAQAARKAARTVAMSRRALHAAGYQVISLGRRALPWRVMRLHTETPDESPFVLGEYRTRCDAIRALRDELTSPDGMLRAA